jgi:prevent-host-death family protein
VYTYPVTAISLTSARGSLGKLIRRAARGERIGVTDHGEVAAYLIGARELADLEDRASIADYERREVAGETAYTSAAEAKRLLGLT